MSDINIVDQLHPGIQRTIQEKRWKNGLSEIQRIAIPVILKREDCIIEAPTAGGKTEAVLFPTLTLAAQDKKSSIQILYLAPLRALLNDIDKRAEKYANACGLHCFKWHGDVGQKEKIEELQNPSQLLLTTPESLEAILLRKAGWYRFFSGLECIIVDEAHNFASGDRGSHLISLIERLESQLKNLPQKIAVTATIGNPEAMLSWFTGKKRKEGQRIFVKPSSEKAKDFSVLHFNPNKYIETQPETQPSYRRLKYLYDCLPLKKSLIFGGSRRNTEAIATAINQLNKSQNRKIPIKVRTHHSAVSKYYREYAESRIKIKNDLESAIDAVISTSTLELGIDIGELDQVIQLDSLSSSSAFLQRVGRTGRRHHKAQFFRGLCIDKDDLVLMTAVVNLGLKGKSEKIQLPCKAFHILAHQLICLSLQKNGIHPLDAWGILSNVSCFSGISEKQFLELVDFMLENSYLRDVDDELISGEESEKKFLGSNWRKLFAVFESGPMYEVYDQKKHVGTLDSAFVEALNTPFLFVLGGIEWKAYEVKTDSRLVLAKKTEGGDAPKWITFQGLDVPFETAKEVGELLFSNLIPSFLSGESKEALSCEQEKVKQLSWKKNKWLVVVRPGNVEIWTFAGDKINRTLAKLITESGLGKATSSFKSISVKKIEVGMDKISRAIMNLVKEIKSCSKENRIKFSIILKRSLRLVPFSKFANCLPENLWAEALSERVFDFSGLSDELKNNRIEWMIYSE